MQQDHGLQDRFHWARFCVFKFEQDRTKTLNSDQILTHHAESLNTRTHFAAVLVSLKAELALHRALDPFVRAACCNVWKISKDDKKVSAVHCLSLNNRF